MSDPNLTLFTDTIRQAYSEAKSKGDIPAKDISLYDQLVEVPAVAVEPHTGRRVFAHRIWRRRVARLYARDTRRRPAGLFGFNFNWEDIYQWLLENIIPVLKMLLTIVPFIL